jgi:hypothetical protein
MERLELHLKGGFIAIMVILGFMSCGLTPLVMWLVSVKDYPKALDAEGVTLRSGQKLPWSQLTEKKKLVLRRGSQKTVTGLGLVFGKKRVNIAPRALVEGDRVLPFLSRILREDLTRA